MHRFIPFALISFLVACNFNQKKNTDEKNLESFEGMITYDVTIEVNDSALAANHGQFYKELYGDKAIIYINDDGSIYRTFPNSGVNGFHSRGYNPSQNVIYEEIRSEDSISIWSATKFEWTFIGKKVGEYDTICDLPCSSIQYRGYEKDDISDTLSFKYFYSSKLYLNPEPYKNWTDSFSGEILQIMKSYMLSSEIINSNYTVRMRAVEIDRKEINDSLFMLPYHKPLRWF
jgi:hypothetical protein